MANEADDLKRKKQLVEAFRRFFSWNEERFPGSGKDGFERIRLSGKLIAALMQELGLPSDVPSAKETEYELMVAAVAERRELPKA